MHSESDIVKIMIDNKTDEVIKELFYSFLSRYQIALEESMTGNDVVFDCITLCIMSSNKFDPRWIIYRFSQMDNS